jgi:hypothetical protein
VIAVIKSLRDAQRYLNIPLLARTPAGDNEIMLKVAATSYRHSNDEVLKRGAL